MKHIRLASISISLALVVSCASAFAENTKSKAQWKREKIDLMEKSTMDQLLADKHAKSLYDLSYGYAVFSSVKVMFGISSSWRMV